MVSGLQTALHKSRNSYIYRGYVRWEFLTKDQRKQWKTDGYLVLKGVLSPEEVQALLATVDEMDTEFRKGENVTRRFSFRQAKCDGR